MLDFAELSDWPKYVRIFLGIFALVPPPVIIPLFLGIAGGRSKSEMLTVARVGVLGFAITLVLFTFLGNYVLAAFGIGLPAFRMAGGFLLLLIALEMIRADADAPTSGAGYRNGSAAALGMVPLAIPILAGPGTLSAVVLFAAEHEEFSHKVLMTLVIGAVAALTYILMRLAVLSERLFSRSMGLVFNKVMGLIVCAVAFEFLMNGILEFLPL